LSDPRLVAAVAGHLRRPWVGPAAFPALRAAWTARELGGLFVPECVSLWTGAVHRGPVCPPSPAITVNSLVAASGCLSVSDLAAEWSRPVVARVSRVGAVTCMPISVVATAGPRRRTRVPAEPGVAGL